METLTPPLPASADPTPANSYEAHKLKAVGLIQDHQKEFNAVEIRRKARKKDETREEMIARKAIPLDGHYIPRRVIDTNVLNDVPAYTAYVEQAPVVVNFTDVDDPTITTKPLEDFATRIFRYPGWNITWLRLADCVSLHGGGVVELTLDPPDSDDPVPGGIKLDYVPREDFIIPYETHGSINNLEMCGRRFQYYPWQLEAAAAKGVFDKEQVRVLLAGLRDVDRERLLSVYRMFFRKEGVIHTFWFAEAAASYLRAPEPLKLGKLTQSSNGEWQDTPVNWFPFFWASTALTEDDRILHVKGRGSKDLADQDALTHIWTASVQAACNAATMTGSFESDPNNPEGQTNQPFKPNTIYAKPIRFAQPQPIDPGLLTIAQALSVTNQAGSGQVDFAANNRVDSRKTAAEIKSATVQRTMLSSTKLVPFAICVREAYRRFWEILNTRITAGLLPPPADVIPYLNRRYQITPAGDVEVLKRDETLQNLQAFYPLVAQTPLGPKVLVRIMELMFPREARLWTQLLEGPNLAAITEQLVTVLENLPKEAVTPDEAQQLQSIIQNARAAIQQSTNAGASVPGMVAPPSNAGAAPASQGAE